MSDYRRRRYQPHVEDWDGEAEPISSGMRTNSFFKRSMNRYIDDDADSGYGSKSATVYSEGSTAPSDPRLTDVKSDIVKDRRPASPNIERSSKLPDPTDSKNPKMSKKPPFCHKSGICWVCDKYGYHFNPKDPSEKITSKSTAPVSKRDAPPPSAFKLSIHRRPAPRPLLSGNALISKTEEVPGQLTRRRSSSRSVEGLKPPINRRSSTHGRPTSVYDSPPTIYARASMASPDQSRESESKSDPADFVESVRKSYDLAVMREEVERLLNVIESSDNKKPKQTGSPTRFEENSASDSNSKQKNVTSQSGAYIASAYASMDPTKSIQVRYDDSASLVPQSSTWKSQTPYANVAVLETSIKNGLIECIIKLVLEDIRGSIADLDVLSRSCGDVEEILVNFADRLRQEYPSVEIRDIVAHIHLYRSSTSTAFKTALSTHLAEIHRSLPSEYLTPNMDDRLQEWLGHEKEFKIGISKGPAFELAQGLTEDPHAPAENFDRHTRLMSNTTSYQWLVATVRNRILLTGMSHDLKHRIRAELLLVYPEPGVDRRALFLPSVEASFRFHCNTSLIEVIQRATGIGSFLTVTGSNHDAQALTYDEYVRQTWPTTGVYVMQLVDKIVLLEPGPIARSQRPDGTTLTASRQSSVIEIKVSGTRYTILEVAEQLSWTAAALSLSPDSKKLTLCSPSVRFVGYSHGLFTDGLTATTSRVQDSSVRHDDSCPSFQITLHYDEIIDKTEPGSCWRNFFENCTIVKGFPILRREEPSLGLELALNMIPWLVDTKHLQQFAGKIFIKSFSTLMCPVKQKDNVLVWHLCCSDTDEPIPYFDHSMPSLCKIDLDDLLECRHIVGWCSKVKNYCGAFDCFYDVERSMGRISDSSAVLHGCDLMFGNLISGGVDFTPTNNHKPVSGRRRTYIDMFRYLEKRCVLFWDTRDLRGWLVNGLQALLHLLRQSLKIDRDEDTSGGVFVLKPEDLEEPKNPHDIGAARVFLNNIRNLRTNVSVSSVGAYHQEYEVLADRMQQFYDVIEKGFNYQRRYKERTNVPRRRLEGWDFVSVAQKDDPIEPSMFILPSVGKTWVDFIRGVGAITFFGEGFGELLKPESCSGLPCGKFYIACAVPTIQQVMTQNRCDERSIPRIVMQSPLIMWYSPPGSLEPHNCAKDEESTQDDSNTQVMWPRNFAHLLPGLSAKPDLQKHSMGAVIFGHNSSMKHYIPDLGAPVFGSPPAPDQELGLFEDSGLGSSIGDKEKDNASTSTAVSLQSPLMSPLSPIESPGQQYGSSTISGGYTIMGNVHGNITVQHYSTPSLV